MTMPRLFAPLLAAFLLPPSAQADCPTSGLTPIARLKGEDGAALRGQRVTVRGVVTGDFRGEDRLSGYWLQTRDGEPSAGIFVFTPGEGRDAAPVAPGVELVIRARAGEFHGLRQLSRVETVIVCGRPGLPAPLPFPFPPATPSALERHEGLYMRIDAPLTVSGHHELVRYGSLTLSAGGRLFRPTNAPGATAADNERRRIVLDDGSYQADPRPAPYLDRHGTRRVGSEVRAVSGILTRAFGDWRLHPLDVATIVFNDANPRPPPPARVGGTRIAGFNVENYFLTLGRRGAATAADLDAQRMRLAAVARGLDAGLVGLIEVENRPAAVDDLARRLGESAGIEGGYRHFDIGTTVGDDVIRVMLAWDPAQVTLLDGPFIDNDPVHHRPPVAGHFSTGNGGPGELVAVIHHKSKSGCPDEGDVDRGQGCWNERRTAQSRALSTFLARLRERTGSDRVLIIGDINSYGDEDPVRVLREAGYVDLVAARLPPASRYSYVFQGESGYLDTALASPALAEKIGSVAFWHVNADEPPELHAFTPSASPGPWRSSDHDPVVIDLKEQNAKRGQRRAQ